MGNKKQENNPTVQIAQLENEIAKLKQTLGGYKTSNEKYRKEIAEQKATIARLQDSITKMQNLNKGMNVQLKEKTEEIRKANEDASYWMGMYNWVKSLPWYKRIFAKL